MKRSAPLLIFLVGCASLPPVPSGPPPVYCVGCPDVLDVSFRGKPEWDAVASVDVDGTLPLGPAGKPTVVGRTPEEVAEIVAAAAGIEPARVSVAVLDSRAYRVYITGPENGRRRVVAYHGPEPAYSLLHRVGAVPPGEANLHDIYLVRANVAAGGPAEVHRVTTTDGVPVRPADQIYVGQTRRGSFERLLPNWLKPLYRRAVGLW